MSRHRVLSVGQCGFDQPRIARHLQGTFDAEIKAAATHAEALASLRKSPFDLVLVNRVGDSDGALGLDLIRSLKADPALAPIPVILVSNYPDAQAEAESLGALPGFGKAMLTSPETKERIARALSSVPATAKA